MDVGCYQAVEELISFGATPNLRNLRGDTPSQWLLFPRRGRAAAALVAKSALLDNARATSRVPVLPKSATPITVEAPVLPSIIGSGAAEEFPPPQICQFWVFVFVRKRRESILKLLTILSKLKASTVSVAASN